MKRNDKVYEYEKHNVIKKKAYFHIIKYKYRQSEK